jgi:hypothetical protein
LRWLPSLSVRLTKFVNMIRKIEKSYRTFSPSLSLPSFGTFRARLQDAPDTADMDAPQAGSEQPSKEEMRNGKISYPCRHPAPSHWPHYLVSCCLSYYENLPSLREVTHLHSVWRVPDRACSDVLLGFLLKKSPHDPRGTCGIVRNLQFIFFYKS